MSHSQGVCNAEHTEENDNEADDNNGALTLISRHDHGKNFSLDIRTRTIYPICSVIPNRLCRT